MYFHRPFILAFVDTDSVLALTVIIIALTITICIYFLPTFIASRKKHPSGVSIFMLNLLVGWTLVGWIAALIWAISLNNQQAYYSNKKR